MTAEIVNAQVAAEQAITSADRRMSAWTIGIMLVTLTVWTLSAGSALKYVIYSLPFTLGCAFYLIIDHPQLRVDPRGVVALAIYLVIALTAMTANVWYDFLAIRDSTIITGYLLLFVLWFRAPSSIADMALATLAVAMVIEAVNRTMTTPQATEMSFLGSEGILGLVGLSNSYGDSLFGSRGIMESGLGFPIGLLALYYLHNKKWRRALVAGLLMFVAFKRIAFLGVALAIGFDMVSARVAPRNGRHLALAAVLALSVTAVFSTQLFEFADDALDLEESSANSISMGRYDIAVVLWDELYNGSLEKWIIGSGPGSSDALVTLWNPHNDWLKILFDYGLAGFAAIHAVLFLNLARHRLGLMIYLYSATLMMTDNVFIYMFYHPFVAIMMCTARHRDAFRLHSHGAKRRHFTY